VCVDVGREVIRLTHSQGNLIQGQGPYLLLTSYTHGVPHVDCEGPCAVTRTNPLLPSGRKALDTCPHQESNRVPREMQRCTLHLGHGGREHRVAEIRAGIFAVAGVQRCLTGVNGCITVSVHRLSNGLLPLSMLAWALTMTNGGHQGCPGLVWKPTLGRGVWVCCHCGLISILDWLVRLCGFLLAMLASHGLRSVGNCCNIMCR
jgi:hypothetical protein